MKFRSTCISSLVDFPFSYCCCVGAEPKAGAATKLIHDEATTVAEPAPVPVRDQNNCNHHNNKIFSFFKMRFRRKLRDGNADNDDSALGSAAA